MIWVDGSDMNYTHMSDGDLNNAINADDEQCVFFQILSECHYDFSPRCPTDVCIYVCSDVYMFISSCRQATLKNIYSLTIY